ncbi:MAG: uroporphyrinogen decarboxylase family protein [Planctomycetota bacterium]
MVRQGGAVDVDRQHVLPFGKPEGVRAQVIERCDRLGRGGGFVFNSIHNLQAKTPIENVVAMIDAIHQLNGVTG